MIGLRMEAACWAAAALALTVLGALAMDGDSLPPAPVIEMRVTEPEIREVPPSERERFFYPHCSPVTRERAELQQLERELESLERDMRAALDYSLELRARRSPDRDDIARASKRVQMLQRELVELKRRVDNQREKNDLLVPREPRDRTQS
ncbi:MAG: hypothetical protein SFX73_22180 [Kofleriaceae bacterium]|nr:hypothetical protein [Kofleriaceae bacterium]